MRSVALAAALVLVSCASSVAEEKPAVAAKPPAEGKPAADQTPPPRVIRYADDKLSLRLDKVRVRDVLDEIARQSGAEISGDVPADAVVSAAFEDLPMNDAMERVYGRKNYTLNYNDKGKLLRITLLGPPLSPEQAAALGMAKTEKAWPFDENIKRSADKVWGFFSSDTRYPVSGRLAEALGSDTATFRDLAVAAARDKDPRVRSAGLKVGMDAIKADQEVRAAFLDTMRDLPDDALARIARQFAQEQAEELVKQVARRSGDSELRNRTGGLLEQLEGMGPDK